MGMHRFEPTEGREYWAAGLKLPERPVRVWGIDLGTTKSMLSEVTWVPGEGLRCECLEIEQPTPEGKYRSPIVPSVVAVLPDGRVWVGEGAKRLAAVPEYARGLEKTMFMNTKNEMGLRRSYPRAPEQLDRPWKVARQILQFLRESAKKASDGPPDRIVVTVPASFQLSQRRDTLLAAHEAGIELADYDLLDEPTAALMDYVFRYSPSELLAGRTESRVIVVDFGGGTCDVSTVELCARRDGAEISSRMLAVSRYHRLGGSDIDGAIVHGVLIPAMLKENQAEALDFDWAVRKKEMEPQLLGTAEALKIGICREIDRLVRFGKYSAADKAAVVVRQPGVLCRFRSRPPMALSKPSLSAAQWEELLEPFIDTDMLYARETEYCLTQSVFSPVADALDRSGLRRGEVDTFLLVGGSCLIPAVREAIKKYLPSARLCTFEQMEATRLAVSRGAAWHAFYQEIMGRPFVQPVVGENIALLTGGGEGKAHILAEAGSPVPHPQDGFDVVEGLVFPVDYGGRLKVEVVTVPDRRLLLTETCTIGRRPGDRLVFRYQFTANRELLCELSPEDDPKETYRLMAINPLVNVVSPNPIRLRIEELQEALREKRGLTKADRDVIVELARLYAEISQYEKALTYLGDAMRTVNRPDPEILHLQGFYCGRVQDYKREEHAYRECYRVSRWAAPLFNLSLSYRRQRRFGEALAAVEEALRAEPGKGPSLTLRGLCLMDLDRKEDAAESFREARRAYGPLSGLSDWELGWLETCMRSMRDRVGLQEIEEERVRRSQPAATAESDDALRPEWRRE